jgi:hypothetical protein
LKQQQQQPEQQPEQQEAASHSTHELLAHLSLVVLLGEAVQLLTQPGCSAALKQLAANTSQQATDHPLLGPPSVASSSSTAQASTQQRFQALLWPPLACWLRQLHSLAAADSQQGSHPNRLAWRQLAAALVQLQLQAQQASPPKTQVLLPLVVLLQQLEGLAVPTLLQAADLAAPLNLEQQHPPEQQLQLLLLIRLARTTASLVAQHACEGSSGAESSTVERGPADDAAAELQQLLLQAVCLLLAAVPATTAAAVVASLCDGASSSSGGGASAEPPSAFVRPLLACSSIAAVPTAAAAADEAAVDAAGLSSPRTSWPTELLSSAQLWPADDDGEDAEAITREERTLRAWINSLLHRGITGSSAAAGSPRAGGQAALLLSGPLRRGSSSGGGSGAVCSSSADDAGMGASDAALASWCAAEPAAPGTPRGSGGAAWHGSSNASSSSAAAAAGAPSIRSITSLFGPELCSGVLLLEILELLAPGSVDWRTANRPPFNKRTAQLQSMENCQLALTIAMVRRPDSGCIRQCCAGRCSAAALA